LKLVEQYKVTRETTDGGTYPVRLIKGAIVTVKLRTAYSIVVTLTGNNGGPVDATFGPDDFEQRIHSGELAPHFAPGTGKTPGAQLLTTTTPVPKLDRVQYKEMETIGQAIAAMHKCTDLQVKNAVEELRNYVRRLREVTKIAPNKTYSVAVARPGVIATAYSHTSALDALKRAKNVLHERRNARARIMKDDRGRVGGAHVDGGWFWGQIREKKRKIVNNEKRPQDNSRYIGVEIECFMKCSREEFALHVVDAFLEKNISLISDSSINGFPSGFQPLEVRVFSKQEEIYDVIDRTCKTLKITEANANKSCGLHVHIDCRNRDVNAVYSRLVGALPLFAAMVPKDRVEGRYCRLNSNRTFPAYGDDRYQAINPEAYRKYKTLEVRLHSGTTNPAKINNWIRLIMAFVEGPDFKELPDRLGKIAKKWNLSDDLRNYIARRIRKFHPENPPFVTIKGKHLDTLRKETGTARPTPAHASIVKRVMADMLAEESTGPFDEPSTAPAAATSPGTSTGTAATAVPEAVAVYNPGTGTVTVQEPAAAYNPYRSYPSAELYYTPLPNAPAVELSLDNLAMDGLNPQAISHYMRQRMQWVYPSAYAQPIATTPQIIATDGADEGPNGNGNNQ